MCKQCQIHIPENHIKNEIAAEENSFTGVYILLLLVLPAMRKIGKFYHRAFARKINDSSKYFFKLHMVVDGKTMSDKENIYPWPCSVEALLPPCHVVYD